MINYYYESPLGMMEIKEQDNKVIKLSFVQSTENVQKSASPHHSKVTSKLDAYFKDSHQPLDFDIHTEGTTFQEQIWTLLKVIPVGTTVSYLEIAKTYGNVKAIRAIGAAIGKNPIAIAIPCHRVIGSDSSLVGYAGGLDKKKALLEHEGVLHQKTLDL